MLCGASVCGKTTQLRLMSGLVPGQYEVSLEGHISINGKAPSSLSSEERAETLGMVFQDPRSQFFMSNMREELAFTGENLGLLQDEPLSLVDKQSQAQVKPHFARHCVAYCSDANLIVLDEPTSGLDAKNASRVARFALGLSALGKAVIIITHDPLLMALAGDHIIKI